MTAKYYREKSSPLGPLWLVSDGSALVGLYFKDQRYFPSVAKDWIYQPNDEVLEKAHFQLEEYFQGKRTVFDLPLKTEGTEFQQRVWKAMQSIPYRQTASYKMIADAIGSPKAIRAVGTAIGRNPLAIIIPCHRVIGSDGQLHGYAGGLDKKVALLALEGVPTA